MNDAAQATHAERVKGAALAVVAAVLAAAPLGAQEPSEEMSFFVTSEGAGNGADFGGLEGADEHCRDLAESVGAGEREWRAYLSTEGPDGVDARDRIGEGPWHNFEGVRIAGDVEELHGDNLLEKSTALDEQGEQVNGVGDAPNRHDILTGSEADGTAAQGLTCENWTSSDEGAAMVGHHDRVGRGETGSSWNAAHPSTGCSQEALRESGGDGLIYCLAAD